MVTAERASQHGANLLAIGWFAGLCYYQWFNSAAEPLPLLWNIGVALGGLLVVSVAIGVPLSAFAMLLTKAATGRVDGSPHAYSWLAFVAPVLAFFAASYALEFVR